MYLIYIERDFEKKKIGIGSGVRSVLENVSAISSCCLTKHRLTLTYPSSNLKFPWRDSNSASSVYERICLTSTPQGLTVKLL